MYPVRKTRRDETTESTDLNIFGSETRGEGSRVQCTRMRRFWEIFETRNGGETRVSYVFKDTRESDVVASHQSDMTKLRSYVDATIS